jgi:hypothetical integral membrane protein (TIGR02206 family)
MASHFILFGPAHVTAIALSFVVPAILAVAVRMSGDRRLTDIVRWFFAAELIATYILWYTMILERGWVAAGTILPMHLCDWAAIACIVTLIRPNQRSYELAYFWALIGTLQATLTPELAYDFPDWRFVVFFAFHSGVIASVLFLTLGAHMRPVPASIPRVVAWTLIYVAAAGTVDWVFGVNFGFLRAKSQNPSVLDALAPWPWYIAELVPIALVAIAILYAPFFVADRFRRRAGP